MLDIAYIRANADLVKTGMQNKGEANTALVDRVLEVDEHWRTKVHEIDTLRSTSNARSKEIGKLMGQGRKEEAQAIMAETATSKEQIKQLEEELAALAAERTDLLYRIPNVPHTSVPVGHTDEDNVIYATWGEPVQEQWRKPHWELAKTHQWIDF